MRNSKWVLPPVLAVLIVGFEPALHAAPATQITSNAAAPGEVVALSVFYEHEVGVDDLRVEIALPGPNAVTSVDLSSCGTAGFVCLQSFSGNIIIDGDRPQSDLEIGQIRLTLSNSLAPGTELMIDIVDEDYEAIFGFPVSADGSFGGRILVAAAADPFEPDNQALLAAPVLTDVMTWRVQTLSAGDQDWIGFEDASPCRRQSSWQLYSQSGDSRFRPVVEVFTFERLTDPGASPVAVYNGCGQTATQFPFDTFAFSEFSEGLWRISNCPNVVLEADERLRYVMERKDDVESCGTSGRVEGHVVNASSGQVLTGVALFVESDEGRTTVVDPGDGSFGLGVSAAIPDGGQTQVTLWPLSPRYLGAPATVQLTDAETVRGVELSVSLIEEIYSSGFE